jgi:hypothetical protein
VRPLCSPLRAENAFRKASKGFMCARNGTTAVLMRNVDQSDAVLGWPASSLSVSTQPRPIVRIRKNGANARNSLHRPPGER